ncbi:MAG: hypothetical protein SFY32_08730 [Bacteroidota bacterium]|nr:hypothetical protein [Bacteroidota bacterium]
MIVTLNVLPKQFAALSIVLKAMKIPFNIEEGSEAYEKKVDENLLKIMMEEEKRGLELYSHKESLSIHQQKKKRLEV